MNSWRKLLLIIALIGAIIFIVENSKGRKVAPSCTGNSCTFTEINQPQ